MRFERRFYGFKDADKPSTHQAANDMVNDFNKIFGGVQADWLEEEMRFSVGDMTFVVFKLTYLDEDITEIHTDEKTEPVSYIMGGSQNYSLDDISTPKDITENW